MDLLPCGLNIMSSLACLHVLQMFALHSILSTKYTLLGIHNTCYFAVMKDRVRMKRYYVSRVVFICTGIAFFYVTGAFLSLPVLIFFFVTVVEVYEFSFDGTSASANIFLS